MSLSIAARGSLMNYVKLIRAARQRRWRQRRLQSAARWRVREPTRGSYSSDSRLSIMPGLPGPCVSNYHDSSRPGIG